MFFDDSLSVSMLKALPVLSEKDFWLLNVLFCSCAANTVQKSYQPFLADFNSRCALLAWMRLRLLLKILLIDILLRLKVIMNQVATKKFCFEYFCEFETRSLNLRERKTCIYSFRALFGFSNFKPFSVLFRSWQ